MVERKRSKAAAELTSAEAVERLFPKRVLTHVRKQVAEAKPQVSGGVSSIKDKRK